MAKWKNQHYVPQHYLRGWAPNNDQIEVFHIEHGPVPPTHISKVCSEDYLYGNPTHIEQELGHLENHHHRPLKALRSGRSLLDLTPAETVLLLSFVTTQRTRSKFTQEDIAAGDEILRDGFRDDIANSRYEDLIHWKDDLTTDEKENSLVDASILGIHHSLMTKGVLGHLVIGDLNGVMLRNTTKKEFVVSDLPIVLDNPRFKQQTGMGPAGLAERGLQIYCPLGPSRLLFLYDPLVYSIESNSRRQVLIKSESVVDELNLLQFHNTDSILMHQDCSTKYLERLREQVEMVRLKKTIRQEHELETGETYEVEKTPPYQVPATSPNLPSYRIHRTTPYTKERPTADVVRLQRIVQQIAENAHGFPDVTLIATIRRSTPKSSRSIPVFESDSPVRW